MLKPTKHLSKFGKKELDHFFAVAKPAKKNQAFTILTNPASIDFGRLLVIINKKYGNAPERNKLRRQFKSIFIQHKLYQHKVDVIVITRPSAKNYDFKNLTKLLLEIFPQNR